MKNNNKTRYYLSCLLFCFSMVQLYSARDYSTYETAYEIGGFYIEDIELFEFVYTEADPDGKSYVKFTVRERCKVILSHRPTNSPTPTIHEACLYLEDAKKVRLASICASKDTDPLPTLTHELDSGTYYVISEPNRDIKYPNTKAGVINLKMECTYKDPFIDGSLAVNRVNLGTLTKGECLTAELDLTDYLSTYAGSHANYGDGYTDFTVNETMDIIISQKSYTEEGAGSYSYLVNRRTDEELAAFTHGGEELCQTVSPRRFTLKPDRYTVVSQNRTKKDARISQSIYGAHTFYGDTMDEAITVTTRGGVFTDHERYFYLYKRDYSLTPADHQDIYYRIELYNRTDLEATLVKSTISNPEFHLLDKSGSRIYSEKNSLQREVLAGTYYIVCSGKATTENKDFQVKIKATTIPPEYQSQAGLNYIESITPLEAHSSAATVKALSSAKAIKTREYFNGLGQLIQSVQIGFTPSGKDLVTQVEYDSRNRAYRNWLPVPSAYSNGTHLDELVELRNQIKDFYGDKRPVTEIVYDTRIDERPVEQTGAGENWKDHPTEIEYGLNRATQEVYHFYGVDANGLPNLKGYYEDGMLRYTKTIDEDGNVSLTYTDLSGKLILERTINLDVNHDTYHVYDEMDRKRLVLPPLATEACLTGNTNTMTLALKQYAYQYKYDAKGLCIELKLPGANPEYRIYDRSGRLILTQTGNQRSNNLWTLNTYDYLGRPLYVAEITETRSRSQLIAYLKNQIVVESVESNGGIGYTNSFFTNNSLRMLTVNYYDNYSFLTLLSADEKEQLQYSYPYQYDYRQFQTFAHTSNCTGLLTGTRTYDSENDDPADYTAVAYYYDYKGNEVQVKSTNHLGGFDHSYYVRNFTGTVASHIHSHKGYATHSERYTYTYDHAERVVNVNYGFAPNKLFIIPKEGAVNSELVNFNLKELSSNEYNERGLKSVKYLDEKRHKIEYDYNIRGWLIQQLSPKFSYKLDYDGYYNGNISRMSWKSGSQDYWDRYEYTYDNLNRLVAAEYGSYGTTTSYDRSAYNVYVNQYDKQGNILQLTRYGQYAASDHSGTNPPGEPPVTNVGNYTGVIDDLLLTYQGNQLKTVTDRAPHDPLYKNAMHFVDGSSNEILEYTYDANGNLTKDRNKNLFTSIYNICNLPTTMWFNKNNGYKIENYYSATGEKRKTLYHLGLRPVVILPPSALDPINTEYIVEMTMDYCGNFIYKNNVLDRVLTSEGYLQVTPATGAYTSYSYLKDHLGNNRVVLSGESIIETNQYYPFGGLFSTETTQNFKFGDKELDRMYGLDLYDFKARQYDPMLGRFMTMDPLAEMYYSWSPYSYCLNNPIKNVDEDGRFVGTVIGGVIGGVAGAYEAHKKGTDIWAGAAEGAVSGLIAGAAVDLAVTATVATGGGALAIMGAGIAAGAVGGAVGAVMGDAAGQAVEQRRDDKIIISPDNFKEKAITGAVTGAISGAFGGGMGAFQKAANVSNKGVKSALSNQLNHNSEALIQQNTSSKIVNNVKDQIGQGMSNLQRNSNNNLLKLEAGLDFVIESAIHITKEINSGER